MKYFCFISWYMPILSTLSTLSLLVRKQNQKEKEICVALSFLSFHVISSICVWLMQGSNMSKKGYDRDSLGFFGVSYNSIVICLFNASFGSSRNEALQGCQHSHLPWTPLSWTPLRFTEHLGIGVPPEYCAHGHDECCPWMGNQGTAQTHKLHVPAWPGTCSTVL